VVWLHLHSVLQRFGATQYLPQALALAVVLEFAPTGAGLIVAGRSGASLGAELGSMRLTEQIDALESMGVSPIRLLVAAGAGLHAGVAPAHRVYCLLRPGEQFRRRSVGRQPVLGAVSERVPSWVATGGRGSRDIEDGRLRILDRRRRVLFRH